MTRVALFASLVLVVGAGCIDAADEEGQTEQGITNCDDGPCPKNSPVIATFPFWELNTDGVPNAQHIELERLTCGTQKFRMFVEKGHIIGRNALGIIQGPALAAAGCMIWIRRGSVEFVIKINAVFSVNMWAMSSSGTNPPIEVYKMDWSQVINGIPNHRGP